MLRASAAATGQQVTLRALTDPSVDSQVPHGAEILAFVTALVERDETLPQERARLAQTAGLQAAAGVATVTGNFEMMNRLVDGAGVPIPANAWELAAEIGVAR